MASAIDIIMGTQVGNPSAAARAFANALNQNRQFGESQAQQQGQFDVLRGDRVDTAQAQQDQAQAQAIARQEAAVAAQIMSEIDPTKRTSLIQSFAQQASPEFRDELAQLSLQPIDQQNAFITAQLQGQGFGDLIAKPKQTTVAKDAVLVNDQGLIIFDGRTSPIGGVLSPEDEQKQVNVLRKSLEGLSKDFNDVEAANARIMAIGSNATPASDLALIFNFMKMLDPASVVRESEFKTAADAKAWLVQAEEGGAVIPAPISNAIRKATQGTILEPAQRTDFLTQVDDLFVAATESQDKKIDNILQQGEQDRIGGVRLLGERRFSDFKNRGSKSKESTPSPTAQLSDDQLQQMARDRGLI